ncbi:hypothetical protein [Fervidibacillus halotolerans]|uniref:Uncharacterized protein n=1 Tax=Fervidibacillus halotolerans TaxID=2980027 RepID=A0A9E8M0A4_9BACI|nr:hypothetical protein [Fervidibacillus halotolerans]WAA13108.1 hypothetical protein OE105_02980 [Fervidibacillus halotolerans]
MWWLILSVFFALSIGYKITNTIYTKQIELAEYNKLYKCDKCGKFHRHYQELLLREIDPNYTISTCPICNNHSSLYIGEEYAWMKTNPECPQLRLRQLHQFKKTLKKIETISKEDASIETFLYYYHLLPEKKKRK